MRLMIQWWVEPELRAQAVSGTSVTKLPLLSLSMRPAVTSLGVMETKLQHIPLPVGFHWQAFGPAGARQVVAVTDTSPDIWLASITDAGDGCTAVIRRHMARNSQIDRPFQTSAAAASWVSRWLDRQGRLIRAELEGRENASVISNYS